MVKDERLGIRINKETKEKLQVASKHTGFTMSMLLDLLIERKLDALMSDLARI